MKKLLAAISLCAVAMTAVADDRHPHHPTHPQDPITLLDTVVENISGHHYHVTETDVTGLMGKHCWMIYMNDYRHVNLKVEGMRQYTTTDSFWAALRDETLRSTYAKNEQPRITFNSGRAGYTKATSDIEVMTSADEKEALSYKVTQSEYVRINEGTLTNPRYVWTTQQLITVTCTRSE